MFGISPSRYEILPGLLLGFHGTDEETAEKDLAGEALESSANEYDWLGYGIYFWEYNGHSSFERCSWAGRDWWHLDGNTGFQARRKAS